MSSGLEPTGDARAHEPSSAKIPAQMTTAPRIFRRATHLADRRVERKVTEVARTFN